MHERDDARLRPEQSRWLRPDFERYLRPDRERYLRPDHARYGRPDAAQQIEAPRQQKFSPAAIAREIEVIREQRAMRAEVLREKHVLAAQRFKSALARALQLILKARSPSDSDPRRSSSSRRSHYDPNQPRVPAGNSDGGQWTDAGGGRGREGWVQVAGPYSGGRGGRSRGGPADRSASEAYRQGRLAGIRRDYEEALRALRKDRPEYENWEPKTLVYSGPGGRTIEDDISLREPIYIRFKKGAQKSLELG